MTHVLLYKREMHLMHKQKELKVMAKKCFANGMLSMNLLSTRHVNLSHRYDLSNFGMIQSSKIMNETILLHG